LPANTCDNPGAFRRPECFRRVTATGLPWRGGTNPEWGVNLALDTDFLDLYRILGVRPDCELVEFKQAYRRRVLVLHPDRRGNDHNDLIASERLQRLTALYGAAIRFEREHGRLPGAITARHVQRATVQADIVAPSIPKQARAPARRSRWLLITLAAAGVGWFWWSSSPPAPSSTPGSVTAVTSAAARESPAPPSSTLPQHLELGMDSGAVRTLEGEPVMINGQRWDYGPSWIRFEDNHVIDWYSSQLRPLKAPRSPGEAMQP